MSRIIAIVISLLLGVSAASAQTTGFTYQGRLTDGGTPASGVYDLQFGLWDSQSSGNQIGSTQSLNGVQVTNGVFTVTLDFGANAFPGASRFLAISARVSGPGAFTLLTPRQPITSTPYAVRSLNAATADSVPASGVPAGSANYIQNSSSTQAANLNVSGNATAGGTVSGGVLNATTQFNLNGSRILSSSPGSFNLFAGISTGHSNTGGYNSFFGTDAGNANTSGNGNSFFGAEAGDSNTDGSYNSFFGNRAGIFNVSGVHNSFVGSDAGSNNSLGNRNSFFGFGAGSANTIGSSNSFIGSGAGSAVTIGSNNTFIGNSAGSNASSINNTLLGAEASATAGVTDATAIGFKAQVTLPNSLVLGSINGINGAAVDTKVGIGTTAPRARLHVTANTANILLGDPSCGSGFAAIGFFSAALTCSNYALLGGDGNTYINRPASGTIIFRENNGANQVEIRPGGVVGIGTLDTGGSVQLCRNGAAAISTCSSSSRYKTEVKWFSGGLQLISRLQPVSFNWKTTHQPDIGLIAEEVAKVDPLFTFTNDKGEIEGVKYANLSVIFINAFKEQQLQIEAQKKEAERQQEQIQRQQLQIDSLRKLLCVDHPTVDVCKSN